MSKLPTSEQQFTLTIQEVTRSFGVTREVVLEIIQEGIVPMPEQAPEEWQFDDDAIQKIRTVLRLHHDLGVNMPGAALAMELLNEIAHLRALLAE